jgi:hypothetical protein
MQWSQPVLILGGYILKEGLRSICATADAGGVLCPRSCRVFTRRVSSTFLGNSQHVRKFPGPRLGFRGRIILAGVRRRLSLLHGLFFIIIPGGMG